jgi:hypothetical protein
MIGTDNSAIFLNLTKVILKRIIPYMPNFNITAASKIDPEVGDSTCAFGSHMCSIKIGTFTDNIIIIIKKLRVEILVEKFMKSIVLLFIKIAVKKGIENVKVIINMNIAACMRSG